MSSEKRQEAIDLSHHFSEISKARATSPLKGLQKYMNQPGLISLAGGTPDPNYFPFASLSAEALAFDSFPTTSNADSSAFSWFWNLFGAGNKERTKTITVGKWPNKPDDLNLARALQYSPATGLPQLQAITREISEKVFQPAYSNWTTLIDVGNTDGWNKSVLTLCNPGDAFLTSDWTYPSALSSALPFDISPVPVPMDGEGMSSTGLRKVLEEWDPVARGKARPRLLYTVPVGQNPTGTTMYGQRKKEIYDICVEFDIIIIEDDPYYFLQEGHYVPKSERVADAQSEEDNERFIASLAPSYLKYDYQGRVIRLDTFSKTIAPGSRLGWFTCSPQIAERLERQGETSTQAPCGFSQVMVASLLQHWQYDGYVRWLRALRVLYTQRRDHFIDSLVEEFDLRIVKGTDGYASGSDVYNAYAKPARGIFSEKTSINEKSLFSFVPPTSGMFIWMRLHFENHPAFKQIGYKVLEEKLFIALAEEGVLVGPGNMFHARPVSTSETGDGHFRVSFSMLSHEEMKTVAKTFGKVVRKFMKGL